MHSRLTSRISPEPRAVYAAEQRSTLSPFHSQLAGSRLEFSCQQSNKGSKRLDNGYSDLILNFHWFAAERENWGFRSMQSQSVCKAQLFHKDNKAWITVSILAH
jgi:hypothetical protein